MCYSCKCKQRMVICTALSPASVSLVGVQYPKYSVYQNGWVIYVDMVWLIACNVPYLSDSSLKGLFE